MLAGQRLAIAVEPVGRLMCTSSPYVAGQRVIPLDVNLDEFLSNDTLLQRLQTARTADKVKSMLKDLPRLKASFDPELTIEFQ